MPGFELAQLNIATARHPLDAPEMADFMQALAPVNALADAAPGFRWRLMTEAGDATAIDTLGDDIIVNLSVWRDIDALHDFVYRGEHVRFIARRGEWFTRMRPAHVVLWWLPAGQRPTVDEAWQRLARLREHGPGPRAFTFKQRYPAPASPS